MSDTGEGKHFKIRIKTQSFEFEVESSDREFVEEKLKEFQEKNESRIPTALSPIAQPETGAAAGKALSLAEFVQKVRANSGTESVVAVGYFLEKYQGLASFTAADIKSSFLKLKYQHSNPSDAIAKARAAGRVMEGPEKSTYVVTQSGEAWVSERLASQ